MKYKLFINIYLKFKYFYIISLYGKTGQCVQFDFKQSETY